MRTPILFIFALTALFLVSVNSCTKTVTQIKEVDSTIRDTLRDTTRDTAGMASIRFLSMFPDSIASLLQFSTTPDGSDIAFTASNNVSSSYFLFQPEVAQTYYLFIPNRSTYFDIISIPPLAAGSISTAAIFDITDGSAFAALGNDSAKEKAAPPGWCYFRFANGVGDIVPQAQVYVYVGGADTSIFRTEGLNGTPPFDRPYANTEISPYVLIPSGYQQIFLRDAASPSGSVLFTIQNVFHDGLYYTTTITGSQGAGNVVPRIYPE